ncbi:peptide synthetase [Pilimelia anulata]|uniref:Peptide synthetase n=1 Tax=Pilimelia anulata TaxID=53371 RepID=A0A8J3BEX0_9ACTN|nr:Pls/PosA family non-ribosomal peptide synthetase [Pilimelia anulata]GGK03725.1 peptide synthetase [Pilimelia anulata]
MSASVGTAEAAALVRHCPGYSDDIRWRAGERLEHLFEQQCDRLRATGHAGQLAVDGPEDRLTYDELDARANQLARHLLAVGAGPGDRIGLLFDRPVHAYVGMLAVLKINAAYVPLDVAFPADRLAFITADAGVRRVLTQAHLRDHLADADAMPVCVDAAAAAVAARDRRRLTDAERGAPVDELCYVVYTSGTTGRPKGVAIEHASICNFLRVADEVYGVVRADRVYQGLTIAFDFSVEEIWVALVAGATLVPKPGGASLLGHELHAYLTEQRVTALCCVPTLLATVEEDLPGLRFLLVSGEACPQHLVSRWHRPDRRFLNVYGPTEATVTATWTPLHPDRPVTLGVPLPTYHVVVLDPDDARALPPGAVGEIGIAGIGLATGYLNRDDLTARAFVPDFLGIDGNPSGRIYRTGDLGRVNDDGEIEYLGRLDTQVKVRGYRIELTEIESVLLELPGVAQAVVDTHEPEPGAVELVAYYSRRSDAAALDPAALLAALRGQLPGYMVPAYLEELDRIPMLPSNKADRKSLPPPSGPRSRAAAGEYAAPRTDREAALADLLAGVLKLDRVSVDSDFFTDLGANSLLLAHFCARIRERADLGAVSMRDVYGHPSVAALAAALPAVIPAQRRPAAAAPAPPAPTRGRTARYLTCGAAQVALFLGYAYLSATVLAAGYGWVTAGAGWADTYRRAVAAGALAFVLLSVLPVAAKWLLIGRFKPGPIPVWGLAYLRFWTVRTLIRWSPLAMFTGSPLYTLYLRLLGARVGRGVLYLSRNAPVCTDLITIGDGAVVSKDAYLTGYRAEAGVLYPGPVSIGAGAFVGQASVLDADTAIGAGGQLGHTSSLHPGQRVPAGARWHGSPGRATDTRYDIVPPAPGGRARRLGYAAWQLVSALGIYAPLGITLVVVVLEKLPVAAVVLGPQDAALTSWSFYRAALVSSLVLFAGGIVAGLALVGTVPRLLARGVPADRVHTLYGFRYGLHRTVSRLTNRQFLLYLFGDSSAVVHYLRGLGYDLGRVEQTGSNFGISVRHDSPYLSVVGTGTMVSDGLSFNNAEYSATSFRLRRTDVGAGSYLGNNIAYPAAGRTGDDCLLATKVMVPVDGPVRTGVGLLGSPCFEIPRAVDRDRLFDDLKSGPVLRRRLAAKLRHNLVTMALFLFVRWLFLFGVLLLGFVAAELRDDGYGTAPLAGALALTLVYGTGLFIAAERLVLATGAMTPRFCSIYDPYYWWHERFWKVPVTSYRAFDGTPVKNLVWKLLGVRIGKRVFDDGAWVTERRLVAIGDDCTLNVGSGIQSHSLEEGTFKSDHTVLGAGCTLGVNAFVHYGVTMGDGVRLGPDSFLMKGEQVPAGAHWEGNPASRADIS